VYKRYR